MSLNVKAYVGISKRKSIKKFEIGNKVQNQLTLTCKWSIMVFYHIK
jgi:hypothetical protein